MWTKKIGFERNFVLKTAAKNRTCVTFLSRQGQRQCLQEQHQQKGKSNETKRNVVSVPFSVFLYLHLSLYPFLPLSLSILSALILTSRKNLLQIKQANKSKIQIGEFNIFFCSSHSSGQFKRKNLHLFCIFFSVPRWNTVVEDDVKGSTTAIRREKNEAKN